MASIAYFPAVETEEQLLDLLCRAAWHLSFSAADRIYVPIASDQLSDLPWTVAPGMDPSISSRFAALREKVRFVRTEREGDFAEFMTESDVILRWKKDHIPSFVSSAALTKWESSKKVWQVDPAAVRMEGSFYIDAANHLMKGTPSPIPASKERFANVARRLGRFKRAYLIATGPSVGTFKKFDFNDSISIVCNSVILDEELMHTAKPKILVFADPIFHFGPSEYAATFRSKLVQSAREHDFTICIPLKYHNLFVSALPELEYRTVALPFTKERDWNFDLSHEFMLRTTANILTFLMVPLGTTFADVVDIIGCDGRPLEQNTYFWGHNANTQLNDKMANIRVVHPGFFAIDYNDYYLEHCTTLESQLCAAEAAGKSVCSIGFSHIPALYTRYGRGRRVAERTSASLPLRVAIIDPDAVDFSGHFMAYNDKLSAALRAKGCEVSVLCNESISTAVLESRAGFVPALTVNSWQVGLADSGHHPNRFEAEIAPILASLLHETGPVLVYMYAGSIEHVKALASVAQRFPQLFVHVNLFWMQLRDLGDTAWVEKWAPFFSWLDSAEPRIRVVVPTWEVQAEIATRFAVILDIAPHPCTGARSGIVAPQNGSRAVAENDATFQILFPGTPRTEKGFDSVYSCARLLASDARVRCVLRPGPAPTSSSPVEQESLAGLPSGATLIPADLSNDAFAALFESSDVVVLPYLPQGFAKRTSGLLIDALHYAVPPVVVEGTWLAGMLRKYRFGVVVQSAAPEDLRQGVTEVLAEIDLHRTRVKEAAKRYFRHNSWESLAAHVLEPLSARFSYPRLAAIDLTAMDGISATGRVKEAFFRGWPADSFLLASLDARSKQLRVSDINGDEVLGPSSQESVLGKLEAYSPDVIYYRAVDNEIVSGLAEAVTSLKIAPLVLHVMDDWPARLASTGDSSNDETDARFRRLTSRAARCLGISDAMAKVFQQRYKRPFLTYSNAVDPAAFPPHQRERRPGQAFLIRYTGALAEDMTLESVKDFASAIESMPASLNVQFEIFTRNPWLGVARQAFSGWRRVKVLEQVSSEAYYGLLQRADAVLIAYNFDDRSRTYIGLSMANKLPEYLASGAPIIAYGPMGLATIDYLLGSGCALVVTNRNSGELRNAVERFMKSNEERAEMGERARRLAFSAHNCWKIAEKFRQIMCAVAKSGEIEQPSPVLLGPMDRTARAHWDETNCVAQLFKTRLSGSVMIDVGAHHGSALIPFLEQGWRIFAFEPDEKNRKYLTDHLARHPNRDLVELDTRCVSDHSEQGVPFFRSVQSTGISGLSAFHETHVEAQRVDTTTLSEYFAAREIPEIDFLKIDTEGHDLFVLRGFPWDRARPKVIECEFEDGKTVPLGYTFSDLGRFLADKGYSVYVSEWHPIVRYGIRHDWNRLVRFPCELADEWSWGNLLAFREPVDEGTLVATIHRIMKLGDSKPIAAQPAAEAPPNARGPAPSQQITTASPSIFFQRREWSVEAGPGFLQLTSGRWRFRQGSGSPGTWMARTRALGFISRRSFIGGLQLVSDSRMVIRVSLARHGSSPYEGASKRVELVAGEPVDVRLAKDFAGQHQALCLQIDVESVEGRADATLDISELYIVESVASVRARLGCSRLTIAAANRLFRSGDLSGALGMYLLLYKDRPLIMYSANAAMAARRLGMDSDRSVSALVEGMR